MSGFGLLEWSCADGMLQADQNASLLCQIPGQGIVTVAEFCSAVHSDDRTAVTHALDGLLQKGEACDVEYRVDDGQNKQYWLRLQGKRRLIDGQCVAMAVVLDISDSKRSEHLLEEIRQGFAGMTGDAFFSALVRHLALGLDVDFVLLSEVRGDRPSRLRTIAGFASDGYEYDEECDIEGTPYELALREGVWACPDGLQKHFTDFSVFGDSGVDSYLGVTLKGQDGRPFGLLSVVNKEPFINTAEMLQVLRIFASRALSEMQRSDAEKQRHQLQQQLQQAHKMEAIGMLAGGIAHDFNNILSTVMGYSGLALRNCVSDKESKLAQYLTEIYQAGERARDLISQLMLFSRGSPGQPQAMAITPLLKESMKLVRATLPSSIDIRQEYSTGLPQVMVDPVSLSQLLTNMSVNARDSMAGQGLLMVRLSEYRQQGMVCSSCRRPVNGNYVDLTISDTGRGVDELDIQRMFDPFYSTKDIGSGRGLGLSVVHGVLHELGGHIIVANNSGHGAIFHLLLPVAECGDAAVTGTAGKGMAAGKVESAFVMIVDDEQAITGYLGDLLEARGFEVKKFTVPEEALQWFADHVGEIDLVISDQTMPGMTGVQLVQALREYSTTLPVILCSGHGDMPGHFSDVADGPGQCLVKPVTIEALISTVNDLLTAE